MFDDGSGLYYLFWFILRYIEQTEFILPRSHFGPSSNLFKVACLKPTLVMESVSLFDIMADAGIDPYIPGASSNSGGTRDTGSAMERGVADAVTERAVDSDDADQWWDGMLGIKKTASAWCEPCECR